MSQTDIEIRVRLNNDGLRESELEARRAAERIAAAAARAAARAAREAERRRSRERTESHRLALAREQLGMRSERAIQREIQRTEAAYNRLRASGRLSMSELERAAQRTRQRVAELNNEMGRLTREQKAQRALRIGASVAAGTVAAGAVLKTPIQRAIDYDYRLAHMANTAFSERDSEGRKIGMKELETVINDAVKQGGGTRESAAEAMDTLLASGAISYGDAKKMLPELMKTATASGADSKELANIGIRALQTMNLAVDEIPNALNQAVAAGQAGGFELRDMSRWLPQQMAAAKLSGMSGRQDLAAILALNQAAAITAGTKDEAGNNVVNLLRKINSQDTAADVKKTLKIDLSGYLQGQRGNGGNSIDAFAALITKTIEKNPKYRALQAKLAATDDKDAQRETLESMALIAQGSSIGKIVQDQQAMMALIALINNQGYMQNVRRRILANDVRQGGAVDKNFALMHSTTGYKLNLSEQLKDMAQKEQIDKLTPAIGAAADAFNKLASEHTSLVGATTLATTALTAFASAAGLAALAMGGGAAAGAAGGAGGLLARMSGALRGAGGRVAAAGSRLLGGAAAWGGRLLGSGAARAAPMIARASPHAAAIATGYTAGRVIDENLIEGTAADDVMRSAITKIAAFFGHDSSQALIEAEASLARSTAALEARQAKPVEVNGQFQFGLAPGLAIQRQSVHVSNGNVAVNTGNINTGAP